MPDRRTGTRVLVALLVLTASAVAAQSRGGWREGARTPYREGMPDQRHGFTFCRLQYTSVRPEPLGMGWSTDYPGSDNNFTSRLEELTKTQVSRWNDGEPGYAVVRPTDQNLFECPFLFASDIGTVGFSEAEATSLRAYLLKGGFLWVDDFWGEEAWDQWEHEIRRVLPNANIVDLTPAHPLFTILYQVLKVPQVPSIQFWRRSGGAISERGAESSEVHLRAILDDHDRLMVLMSHNTDIADGWEREGEDRQFFDAFSPAAYAIGINIALWVMSH